MTAAAEGRDVVVYALCSAMACAAALAVFFRGFFSSHFNLIAGDIGDNRLCIVIFEHWRAVMHGHASLTSPGFFWPQPHVLGYSEAMFLTALPYSVARSFGLDEYLSFEITLLIVKAVGFFGMLWLLLAFVRLTKLAAVAGAALFTLSNAYYLSVGHSQLLTVAFTPLLYSLMLSYWRKQAAGRTRSAVLYVSTAGI
jgi:hypothetical protein